MSDVENTIIDLQTKLSFQDDLLDDLNQVVTDQQQQIMRIESTLDALRVQIKTLQTDNTPGEAKESPPPHY